MAVYCPMVDAKVPYLTCADCDERASCKRGKGRNADDKTKKKEKPKWR